MTCDRCVTVCDSHMWCHANSNSKLKNKNKNENKKIKINKVYYL